MHIYARRMRSPRLYPRPLATRPRHWRREPLIFTEADYVAFRALDRIVSAIANGAKLDWTQERYSG